MKKNYQLDFLKLIFALIIVLHHTMAFYKDELPFFFGRTQLNYFGRLGVQIFFIISGLLMTNSLYHKSYDPSESGRQALAYILKKGKALFLPCFTAALIMAVSFIVVKNKFDVCYQYVPAFFWEIFFLRGTGVVPATMFNGGTWYISSMLVAMLPMCYLMIRNRDFYLHIAAPLTGFLLLGYMFNTGDGHMPLNQDQMYGFLLGGIIRALSGIALGSVAWLISEKLKNMNLGRKKRMLLTAGEAAGFAVFFSVSFSEWAYSEHRAEAIYFAFVLMTVLLGVVFSEKSYISKLFDHKIFMYCGSLSLIIYLNHMNARFIIKTFFMDLSYLKCLLLMAAITVVDSLVYLVLLKLFRSLANKVRAL